MSSFTKWDSPNDTATFVINEVTLPRASFGACKYWRKCDNLEVELGNGLCMGCYDKGLGGLYAKEEGE